MTETSFPAFLNDSDAQPFAFIDPDFTFNAPNVSRYGVEVSGYYLLKSMARRLGWSSLSGKKILDFGCGVRFARTIVNLGIDIGHYAGVDVNAGAIDWLASNVADPRFQFLRINDYNPLYAPDGRPDEDYASLQPLAATDFDVVCMFSVITHQRPAEAKRIFSALRNLMQNDAHLYFTAFLDREIADYGEANEAVCMKSTYHPDYLIALVEECGWKPNRIYERSTFQQFAFVCR